MIRELAPILLYKEITQRNLYIHCKNKFYFIYFFILFYFFFILLKFSVIYFHDLLHEIWSIIQVPDVDILDFKF